MKKAISIIVLSLLVLTFSFGLDKINTELFQYVKNSTEQFETIEELHDFLIKPTKTDTEKAEIFFYWIAQNIEYDIERSLSDNPISKENPLVTKKGVCDDYSIIFLALCKRSNIECYKIIGYAKGGEDSKSGKLIANHAWNIVKIDATYKFVDTTWGSGYVKDDKKGKSKYVKELDLQEVFVNTETFRATHLPASPKWQLLEKPISYKRFIRHKEFNDMKLNYDFVFNYKDSIEAYKKLSSIDQLIAEGKSTYTFNPSPENALELAIYYSQAAYQLAEGEKDVEQLILGRAYYYRSKKWNAKASKGMSNKAFIRTHKTLKSSNTKAIRYCNFMIKNG